MIYNNLSEYLKLYNDLENKNKFVSRNVGLNAMIIYKAAKLKDKLINLENNECYYTESVVLEKPLGPEFVGNDIGKFMPSLPWRLANPS